MRHLWVEIETNVPKRSEGHKGLIKLLALGAAARPKMEHYSNIGTYLCEFKKGRWQIVQLREYSD